MRINKIEVIPIRNLNNPQTYEDYTELVPISSDANINNFESILREHHILVGAGVGEYKIYGCLLNINISTEADEKILTTNVVNFIETVFGETNVLSLKYKKADSYDFKALIYPLTIRKLTPEKWFDIKDEGKVFSLKMEYIATLKSHFEDIFKEPVSFDESIGFKDANVVKLAAVDLIKDMQIDDINPDIYKEKIYDAYGLTKQADRDMPFSAYLDLVRTSITYFTTGVERGTYYKVRNGQISEDEFMMEVGKYAVRMRPEITDRDKAALLSEVRTAIFGNYILEPLLNASDISDIKVLSPQKIRVKCNGKRMTSNVTFIDDDDYYRFFKTLAIKYGIDYGEHAIFLRTDRDSNPKYILRINITTPAINSSPYPYLHIRKIRKQKMTMEELISLNCVPRHVAKYLINKINTSNMIFCGKGGSGKTTFMNTLIDHISYGCSGACYQESEELFSYSHPDFMWQHYVPAGDGYAGFSLKEEARNGLRTDLDYLIIGEITGSEARDFLTAVTTGHRGMCSIHSYDTKSATDRMTEYIMRDSSDYTKEQAMYMLKEVGCIVYMENFKVKEISEIEGYDEEKKELKFKIVYKL